MATGVVSGDDDKNRQSINLGVPAGGFSPGSTFGISKKIQQFPKHDTVKPGEHNFLLWKQQVLLILEGYGLHSFVLGTVSVPL